MTASTLEGVDLNYPMVHRIPVNDLDYELVIQNGRVVDGTGNSWYRADLGIADGRIMKISRVPLTDTERVVDVGGMVVAPGFINIHSHSDGTILTQNNAENCVAMGLVTELVGSCGASSAPFNEAYRDALNERRSAAAWGFWEEVDCLTLADWAAKVEARGAGVNLAPLVGHGTVRACVMGEEGSGGERVQPTDDEMEEMRGMVGSAMSDGAFGLSTGLTYAPGRNALTEELVQLVEVAAEHGGVYTSHMRNEGGKLIEATKEFIEICERTGARGTISHHKASGPSNFGKVHETLRLVEAARRRGVDIIVDMYPWRIGGLTKSLGGRFKGELPDGSSISTRKKLLEGLRDPERWAQIKAAALANQEKARESYEDRKRRLEEKGGWTPEISTTPSGVVLHSPSHPELEWSTFHETAEALGEEGVLEGIRALLIADDGFTVSGNVPYSEEDVESIIGYPWTTFITDQRAIDNSKYTRRMAADALAMEHPRGWGTYPRVLGRYVRERGVLGLEDAIRRMTSLPAAFLGLSGRGLVKQGFWADLVVFDPATVGNRATYADPFQFPEGIPFVLVNGRLAVDGGDPTGALAGKVLRHTA